MIARDHAIRFSFKIPALLKRSGCGRVPGYSLLLKENGKISFYRPMCSGFLGYAIAGRGGIKRGIKLRLLTTPVTGTDSFGDRVLKE